MAEQRRPDSVVIDAAIPVLDGAAVLKRLRDKLPIRVVLLQGHSDIGQLRSALHYHPDSLLPMDTTARCVCDELVAIEVDGVLSLGRLNLERTQCGARPGQVERS